MFEGSRRFLVSVLASVLIAALGIGFAQDKLVIAGRDSVFGQSLELAVKLYQEANPDVDIELLQLPYGNLFERLVISMREATGAFDLVMLDDTWATQFMSNGWLANLEEMGVDADPDFVSSTVGVSRFPFETGALYALPFVGNVEMFAYRADLFEKYGLARPTSWTDVVTAADIISANEPDVNGVVFRGTKGNPIVTGFMPIFWAYGASIIDENGEAAVDSPEAVKALELYLSLKADAPEGVEVYNSSEVRDALQQGTAAIAIEVWPSWIPNLDNPDVSTVVGKFNIIPAPGQVVGSSPMLGSWLLGIAAQASNPDRAKDFLEFVTSAEIQKTLALEIGLPPTRESLYRDADILTKFRWYPGQLEALKNARPRPRITQWSQVEAILGDFLQLALIGQLSPGEALGEANQAIAAVLDR